MMVIGAVLLPMWWERRWVKAKGSPSTGVISSNLALPDGEVVRVSFDDWMYLLDEDRLINRAEISKFGIHLGEVILYIERQP